MDWRLFHWVNRVQVHTAWAHAPLRSYAKAGIVVFAVMLVVGWLLARARDLTRMAGVVWAAAVPLIGLALNQAVGRAVDRSRPYAHHRGVNLLVARTSDVSFPSDHAVVAGAVAAALWFVDRRLGLLATLFALLMAFARVYVGAHYPGDVAAGLLVGAALAVVGRRPAVAVLTPILTRLQRSPARALVASAR